MPKTIEARVSGMAYMHGYVTVTVPDDYGDLQIKKALLAKAREGDVEWKYDGMQDETIEVGSIISMERT